MAAKEKKLVISDLTITAPQWFAAREAHELTPAEKLYHALLVGAVDDWTSPKPEVAKRWQRWALTRWARRRDEAKAWFEGEGAPYVSFVECCHVLNIDPDAARKELLAETQPRKRAIFHKAA